MQLKIACPNPECSSSYHVEDSHVGGRVVCKQCGREFVVAGDLHDTDAQATAVDTRPPATKGGGEAPKKLGRFEIGKTLGAGAFGTVYHAHDPVLGRKVAIKVPHTGRIQTEADKARFFREAKLAAQLRHPNIVPVYEAGEDQGKAFIASAFIEGQTLQAKLAEGSLDFDGAAATMMELAQALDYAHRQGVVHRDVKPSNIMLDQHGVPLLMDFGLAQSQEGAEKLTQEGAVMGTPAYMSPEQARGDGDRVGPASDQYNLGVVLYELLCGETPFSGPPAVVIFNVVSRDPPSPREIKPEIPRDLETIALKAMAREPAARYSCCREMADDLRRWREGEPILARPIGRVERLWRWSKRNPVMAALTAAVAIFASAVVIGSPIWAIREKHAAQESVARRLAEDAAQRFQAENHLRAAQLAARRGDWQGALKELDAVEKTGAVPLVAISLERVRALDALDEFAPWAAEIDRLQETPQLEGYRGQVLFWQAIRHRSLGNESRSTECFNEALKFGLPPGDEAYVKALLAETTPESRDYLEETLRYDPTHHGAMLQYIGILLFSGNRERAKDFASSGGILFPQDPNFTLALAIVAALEEKPKEAERLLGECEGRYDAPTIKQMRTFVQAIKRIPEIEPLQGDSLQMIRSMGPLFLAISQGFTAPQADRNASPPQRITPLFGIPPSARRAYETTFSAIMPSISSWLTPNIFGAKDTERKDESIAMLREAVRLHPEGTLYMLLGMALFDKGRVAEAEEAFRKAAETPAVLPRARRISLFMAGLEAMDQHVYVDREAGHLKRAIGYWRTLIGEGTVEPEQVAFLLLPLIKAKEFDLLRQMLNASIVKYPARLDLRLARAEVEMAAGEPGAAWEAAGEALKQEATNKKAVRIRSEAAEKLKQQFGKDIADPT